MTPTQPLQRDQILEEAARLFQERGYERTRMQDIASTFGATHAALYYYFPRKSDILAELNLSALDILVAGASAAEEAGLSASEQFQRQLEAHIRFVVGNVPLAACFFLYDKSIEPADLKTIRGLRRRYTEMLTASFAAAQDGGEYDNGVDAKTAVNTLLGAANWMYRWLVVEDGVDPEEWATQIGRMLAAGYRGRSAPLRDTGEPS